MGSKKRILEEKKIPKYRQSHIKKERRKTLRSEPQNNQTEFQFTYGSNKYSDHILEVSPRGCKITTEAPLRVGDVIKFQQPAAISGRVVWGEMGVFGIEFID